MKKTIVRNGELVKYEIVKSAGNLKIIKAFANIEDGIYGNVYADLEELETEYPNQKYMYGYMLFDENTGYVPSECCDFWYDLSEAESEMLEVFGISKFDEIDKESVEYLSQLRIEDEVRMKMEDLTAEQLKEVESLPEELFPSYKKALWDFGDEGHDFIEAVKHMLDLKFQDALYIINRDPWRGYYSSVDDYLDLNDELLSDECLSEQQLKELEEIEGLGNSKTESYLRKTGWLIYDGIAIGWDMDKLERFKQEIKDNKAQWRKENLVY